MGATVRILDPQAQMDQDRAWIDVHLRMAEVGHQLLDDPDPTEVERGRFVIALNRVAPIHLFYDIGQIRWRLGLGDPGPELVASVSHFATLLRDTATYGLDVRYLHQPLGNGYWAHLVAFECVVLTGVVPDWVNSMIPDGSWFGRNRKRLTPWEINLGYQYALARAIHRTSLPDGWERFAADSAGRPGLKKIRQNVLTYERLFLAAKAHDWAEVIATMKEVDTNFRKRGSAESSYPHVYGDGPFNDRAVDFVAAAILRSVDHEPGFPREQLKTPHLWRWGSRDLSRITPA